MTTKQIYKYVLIAVCAKFVLLDLKPHGRELKVLIPAIFLILTMTIGCDKPDENMSPAFNSFLQTVLSGSVTQLSVDELSHTNKKATLIDVRDANEYNVSHIPGSSNIPLSQLNIDAVDQIPKETPIVVYCSVGYRSEKAGLKLIEMGYSDVTNLYGGIFEWVNQGNPVINDEGVTQSVHPYSLVWGAWIRNDTITKRYKRDM